MGFMYGIVGLAVGAFFTNLVNRSQFLLEKRRHDFAELLTAVKVYLLYPNNDSKEKGDPSKPGTFAQVRHRLNLVLLVASDRTNGEVHNLSDMLEDWSQCNSSSSTEEKDKKEAILNKLENVEQLFRNELFLWKRIKSKLSH